MNYGWNNLQPNQPPSGFPSPSGPGYPFGPTPGCGIPTAMSGASPGPNWGAPEAPCSGGQMPVPGYGGGQVPVPGYGGGQVPVPGYGGGQVPVPGYGGGQMPVPGYGCGAGDIGFGNLFNNAPQTQPPQPSAPSAPPMSNYGGGQGQPTAFGSNQIINAAQFPQPVEAGRPVKITVVPPRDQGGRSSDRSSSDTRRASPLPSDRRPKSPHSLTPRRSPSPNPATDGCNSETDARRNTSRYQEGLKNMANLMTDVDINDEVLDKLKDKFDLRK